MAKKRVEEPEVFTVDDTFQEQPRVVMQNKAFDMEENPANKALKKASDNKELVNCLRNERVIVRFVPRLNAMIQDKNHILGGGMADTATRSFVVPRLSSTGIYKNILTNSEMAFLESAMGLEKGTLSIYRKQDNFWDDSNPNGIGRVTLHKQDNILDLSTPADYIKYKILLANPDQIASSLEELENRRKATHQFVIISENAETASNLTKADTTMKCYMEYGKIENDEDTLKCIIETLEGRPISGKVQLDFLKGKVIEWISRNPKLFLVTIKDELLPTKVLIRKCIEAGLISKRNNLYYMKDDGQPLCELGEDSTLNNAARYISSIKRQELKYSLEAKLKQ